MQSSTMYSAVCGTCFDVERREMRRPMCIAVESYVQGGFRGEVSSKEDTTA